MTYEMTKEESRRWDSDEVIELKDTRSEIRSSAFYLANHFSEPIEIVAHDGTLLDFVEPDLLAA